MESQVNENSQNGVNEINDKRKGYNKVNFLHNL